MSALIVILVIIAFIALLACIPIRFNVCVLYSHKKFDCTYRIKYGFITIKNSNKQKKPKERKENGTEQKDKIKSKDKISVKDTIRFCKDNSQKIKKLISSVVSYLTRHCIKIEKFGFKGEIGTDDAMHTALIFGSASAVLYNSLGLLDKAITVKNIKVDFKPDFNDTKIFIELESIIKTRIYNIAALGVIAFVRALPLIRKRGDFYNGKSD